MIRLLIDPDLWPGLVWLASYLIHSTLWVAGAWLIWTRAPGLPARTRNLIWRMALVGPLVSMLAQAAAGDAWSLRSVELAAPVAEVAEVTVAVEPIDLTPGPELAALPALAPAISLPAAPALPRAAVAAPAAPASLWTWVLIVAGLIALGRLGFLVRGLRRSVVFRQPVVDARLLRTFRRLRASIAPRAAVRLTESNALSSPIALLGGEICLPARIVALDDAALEAVLAHELAHVERRDNLWLLIGATVEAVLFFQPLNWLARRGLQESAELASDERAVELTGDPLGMARSLAEVATWGLPLEAALLGSPVVSGRGALLRRVNVLLGDGGRRARSRWLGPALVVALAALALSAPAIAPTVHAAVKDAGPRAAPVAPVVPPAPVAPSAVIAPPALSDAAPSPSVAPAAKVAPAVKVAPAIAPVSPVRVAAPVAPAPPQPIAPVRIAREPRAPRPPRPPRPPNPPRVELSPGRIFALSGPRPFWGERSHGRAYVLVGSNGRATAGSASNEDLQEATAARADVKGEYLWVRRRDQRVVITAPEAIASIRPLLDQQRSLRDQELQLGVKKAELARRQAELGKAQAELGIKHAELGARRAELAARRAEIALKKMHARRKSGDAVSSGELKRRLEELARADEELRKAEEEMSRKQDDLGRKQGDLGRARDDLGRQQGDLGRQFGELAREQSLIAVQQAGVKMQAAGRIDQIVDQQVSSGKARILEPGKGR